MKEDVTGQRECPDGEKPVCVTGKPAASDVLIVYVLVLAYIAYAGYGFRAIGNKWLSLCFSAGFGILPLAYSLFRGFRVNSVFAVRKPSPRSLFGGIVLIVGVFSIVAGILSVVGPYLPRNANSDSALQIQVMDESVLYSVLALAAFPAIFEEVLCRGFLLSGLRLAMSRRASIALCAFLFALLHMDPGRMPFTFIAGLALSWAAVEAESLFVPITMHFAYNFLLFAAVRFGKALPISPGAVAAGDRYAVYRFAVIWVCVGALLASIGASLVRRRDTAVSGDAA